jgi:transcriptional regulator with XRE-family HTH domain
MIEGFREPPMISLIIREVRKAGKITQEVIAKHLGMTRSNYSKKETRIIEFTFNEVFHILDLLDHHLSSDIMEDIRYRIYGIKNLKRKKSEGGLIMKAVNDFVEKLNVGLKILKVETLEEFRDELKIALNRKPNWRNTDVIDEINILIDNER